METRTQGIVVGYDGSPDADEAARWAANTARLSGRPLAVLIVADPMESPRTPGWAEPWWNDVEDRARTTLAAADASDVAIERRRGALVPTLVDAATDASMLVLGSRGHSRVGELILGSVSQSAARRARCPVVVVRKGRAPEARRIVVGVDGSQPSRRALDVACRHGAVTGDEVLLLRAWRPLVVPIDKHGDVPASMSATLLEEEEALLKDVAEARARYPEVAIDGEFIATGAGQALVDASDTAAMVVVGSRGHSAVTETVLGSVSHHVLHRAHCTVAVVH